MLFTFEIFGQESNNMDQDRFVTITENDSLNIKIIKRIDDFNYYLLEANNNQSIDTIEIDLNDDGFYEIVSCDIQAKQLDGKGRKEIIIETELSFSYSAGLNSGETTMNVLQIWNLDSQKKMFNAEKFNLYSGSTGEFSDDFEVVDTDTVFYRHACFIECVFSYELEFYENSELTKLLVKNLKKSGDTDCHDFIPECEEPDHKEGTYEIRNGIYSLEKEKDGR
jgi:hypothetical protein